MRGKPSTINLEDQEVRRVFNDIIAYINFLDQELKAVSRIKTNKPQGMSATEMASLFFPINTFIQGGE